MKLRLLFATLILVLASVNPLFAREKPADVSPLWLDPVAGVPILSGTAGLLFTKTAIPTAMASATHRAPMAAMFFERVPFIS